MDSAKEDLENSEIKSAPLDTSFRTRLLVADIFVPITVFFAFWGGIPFAFFVGAILCVAAWEFWRVFSNGGYSPSLPVMLFFTEWQWPCAIFGGWTTLNCGWERSYWFPCLFTPFNSKEGISKPVQTWH